MLLPRLFPAVTSGRMWRKNNEYLLVKKYQTDEIEDIKNKKAVQIVSIRGELTNR